MLVTGIKFKGMINLIGKDYNILVNHNAVESISAEKYLDTKRDKEDESLFSVKIKQGTYLNLMSGNRIKVFAPMEEVVNAYQNSENANVELKTKHNPFLINNLL